MNPPSFNPLDYSSLSSSLADALMNSPLAPLSKVEPFYGYGVYALFYVGDYPAYHKLSEHNRIHDGSWPIYIGKSSPSTRKGIDISPETVNTKDAGKGLYNRISTDHRRSIENASNLDIADFSARLLVLSYVWVPLAETALIARYEPVWNSYVDGFGNHDPGMGRQQGRISHWDVLHPGRGHEKYAPSQRTMDEISREVTQRLEDTWQRKFQ